MGGIKLLTRETSEFLLEKIVQEYKELKIESEMDKRAIEVISETLGKVNKELIEKNKLLDQTQKNDKEIELIKNLKFELKETKFKLKELTKKNKDLEDKLELFKVMEEMKK